MEESVARKNTSADSILEAVDFKRSFNLFKNAEVGMKFHVMVFEGPIERLRRKWFITTEVRYMTWFRGVFTVIEKIPNESITIRCGRKMTIKININDHEGYGIAPEILSPKPKYDDNYRYGPVLLVLDDPPEIEAAIKAGNELVNDESVFLYTHYPQNVERGRRSIEHYYQLYKHELRLSSSRKKKTSFVSPSRSSPTRRR